jgi:predicted nucleic acid-binding protein
LIVIDASVVVELLLRTPHARRIEDRVLGGGETLAAPALLDIEVVQVLRRYVLRGEIAPLHGQTAMSLLGRFPIRRHGHGPLLSRVWELRENITAYDAAYVALAEGLGATLVTRDARLARSAGHTAVIELV